VEVQEGDPYEPIRVCLGVYEGRALEKRKWKKWSALEGEGFGEFIFLHNAKSF
jgi:hypothetical protein